MSPNAVVCPHCGVRQAAHDWGADAEVRAAKVKLPLRVSADEARALIYTDGAHAIEASQRGPMALVSPRADSTGWVRTLEWALTIVASPLLMVAFVMLVVRWRLWRALIQDGREVGLTFVFGFFGAIGLASITTLSDWEVGSTSSFVGLCLGALFARMWLRRWTR